MGETSTNSGAAPFDLDGLNKLYGQETVVELLQMSVDEATGLLQQIDSGISDKDSKMVMAASHQLKGLASTMTISKLADISLEIETAARQEQWAGIDEMRNRLKAEFDHVASYIQGVLATL